MNPLVELRFLSNIADFNTRIELIEHWIQKNIVTISQSQYIVNKKQLTSEQNDLIFDHLAQSCAEEMINNGVAEISTSDNICEVRVVALKYGKK